MMDPKINLNPREWGIENQKNLREIFWRAGLSEDQEKRFLARGAMLRALDNAKTLDEVKAIVESLINRIYAL